MGSASTLNERTSFDLFGIVGVLDDNGDDQCRGIGVGRVRVIAQDHERIDRPTEIAETGQTQWIVAGRRWRLRTGHEMGGVVEEREEIVAEMLEKIFLGILVVLQH